MFQDATAKAMATSEASKRNTHISRFHPLRWKALWTPSQGWHVELRPCGNNF